MCPDATSLDKLHIIHRIPLSRLKVLDLDRTRAHIHANTVLPLP